MRIGRIPSRVKDSFTLIALLRELGVTSERPPCPVRVNSGFKTLESGVQPPVSYGDMKTFFIWGYERLNI